MLVSATRAWAPRIGGHFSGECRGSGGLVSSVATAELWFRTRDNGYLNSEPVASLGRSYVYVTHLPKEVGIRLIVLGLILLIIGFIANVAILWTIGIILLVVGLILVALGATGRAVGGRRHFY